MIKNIIALSTLSLFLFSSVGCGKLCDQLEGNVCSDLGAADCKIWKEELGGLDSLRSGRGASKQCGNLLIMGYDPLLNGYKNGVAAMKKSRTPKAKAKKTSPTTQPTIKRN